MGQLQLPLFPDGTTEINTHLAFCCKDNQITYFYGHLPVFHHAVDDLRTFRLITSQLYVNGNATQSEICRAFGVSTISVKRSVKLYREKGSCGFYEKPKRRGAVVLTPAVLAQALERLDDGLEPIEVAEQLSIKSDTLRKAIASGRLHQIKKSVYQGLNANNATCEHPK